MNARSRKKPKKRAPAKTPAKTQDELHQPQSLRQCQRLLHLGSKGRFLAWAKRDGFPRLKDGRVLPAAVAAWIDRNIKRKKPWQPAVATAPAENDSASGDEHFASSDANVQMLLAGEASALDISRAAMRVVAAQVARRALKGAVSGIDLDALKKTLGELRQAEQDYVEMAARRRELIDRSEVKSIVGAMAARLVRCLNVLEANIATEFSIWLADDKIRSMAAADRARAVRQFIGKTCADVRRLETEKIESLIDSGQEIDDHTAPS